MPKTQVNALRYLKTGEIIYSRAHHDFRSTRDGKLSIDGDFNDCKINYETTESFLRGVIEVPVSSSELFNDWNENKNQYGWISPEDAENIKFLDKSEILDKDSFEYRKMMAIWRTNGPDGNLPTRYINLISAETDHLEKILLNVRHLTAETREIIESILKDRKAQ